MGLAEGNCGGGGGAECGGGGGYGIGGLQGRGNVSRFGLAVRR